MPNTSVNAYSICSADPYQSMCHQGDTCVPSGPQSHGFPDRCIQSHNRQAKSAHCESAQTSEIRGKKIKRHDMRLL